MKNTVIVLLVMFAIMISNLNAQNKKEIKENGIKSITVYEEKVERNKKEVVESVTTYDKNGNEIEIIEYNSEGKFKKHIKCEYNGQSLKIKEVELDESGDVVESVIFKYENGLRTERIKLDGKGEVLEKKRYVYTYTNKK